MSIASLSSTMVPRLLTTLFVIASLAVVGNGTAQEARTLVVGSQNDARSIDPADLGPVETDVAYKIYSSLVRQVPGTIDEYVGDLAETWTVSEDGTVYTFQLREGVQWHRGYGELTAHDVKYSFERLKDLELGSPLVTEAERIDEVVVVDDYTVEVRLNAPWPDFFLQFLSYRGGFISNQRAIEEFGTSESLGANAIGSGPYTLERWSPREEIVVQRNPDYYGPQPYFDTIRYDIIQEESVMEVALLRGEIDIFYATDPVVALSVLENPSIKTERFLSERMYALYINTERPPLDDARVRRALWLALDKAEIVEVGFEGLGRAMDTLLGENIPNNLQDSPYEYDPEQAIALLEEAGFDFNVVLNVPMDERSNLITPIMQAQWARIGVRTSTPMMERLQHLEELTAGNFDMGLRTAARATADQYFSHFLDQANIPYPAHSRYWNDDLQTLIDAHRAAARPEEVRELAYRIQEFVHQEAPVIPIAQVEWVVAMRPDIEGAFPGVFRITAETIRRGE